MHGRRQYGFWFTAGRMTLAGILLSGVLRAGPLAAQPPSPEAIVPPTPTAPAVSLAQAARDGALHELVLHALSGSDLQQRDQAGNSLLHVASAFGHLPAAAWLVEQGLDPRAPNAAGLHPIELADANQHEPVVAYLLSQGATLRRPRSSRQPPEPQDLTYRAWTSASGESIEAAFISLRQDQLILKARDDSRIAIPMQRLAWRDQIMARRMAGQPGTTLDSRGRHTTATRMREIDARITTAFGPDCEELLRAAISDARREILIAIYTFTSPSIARALTDALSRGVTVQLKYDEGQIGVGRMEEWIKSLQSEGAKVTPIAMSGRFASMHHKFAVLDQASVFTGSYNFTVTAGSTNYENAVLIRSDSVADLFTQEFERIESR